ncbi:DUF433 domain-containing protein [Sphaerisporangium rubeum]|uniref:Uncharacterized protein (DUF433 family) n=1 Tax=Sphaerisporangium rubeum TaxID=321317 RepID=A0A7X0I9P7_9ACTN|nr:uncharacterized protein (DUF433 family) [Sphaerisporangium rubeum]
MLTPQISPVRPVLYSFGDVVAISTFVRLRGTSPRKADITVHHSVDVLRPFYRDGRHIPDLLRPRRHVTVDPAVRGGDPVIVGTRIPYDEVTALLRDGVPAERVRDYYPAVTAPAAIDAADFADYIDSYEPSRETREAAAG